MKGDIMVMVQEWTEVRETAKMEGEKGMGKVPIRFAQHANWRLQTD